MAPEPEFSEAGALMCLELDQKVCSTDVLGYRHHKPVAPSVQRPIAGQGSLLKRGFEGRQLRVTAPASLRCLEALLQFRLRSYSSICRRTHQRHVLRHYSGRVL